MTFINNVKNNVETIKEIISDAGLFKEKFSEILNITDTINNDIKEYNKISKKTIYNDVYELILNKIDYNKERSILSNKLKSNDIPEYGEIEEIPTVDFKLNRLNNDYFIEMISYLDESDKKSLKRYLVAKKNTLAMLNDFIAEITTYENKMVSFRKKLYVLMQKNTKELFNIHASYAYTKKHNQNIDIFSHNFPNLILCNSQKDFIEKNLKQMIIPTSI